MKYPLLFVALWLCITSCKTSSDEKEINPHELIQKDSLRIKGILINKENISGNLNVMGFFVEPMSSGILNSDGSISITLPASFDKITQTAFNTYNNQDSATYRLKMNTVGQSFSNLDELETKGLENEIALAGKFYGFTVYKDDDRDGAVYPTSSPEFMTYIIEQKQEGALTGFYYAFMYATKESIIKGKTTFEGYLDEQTNSTFKRIEEYDITLNPGWNIVKYEILKTEKTAQNTSVPAHVKQCTVNELEKNTPWFHIRKNSQAL